MTNSEIVTSINTQLKALTKAFDQSQKNTPTDIRSEWLPTIEASHALGISTNSLHKLRNCGSLPYSRVHGKIYYKRSDIEALLERNYTKFNRNNCCCK